MRHLKKDPHFGAIRSVPHYLVVSIMISTGLFSDHTSSLNPISFRLPNAPLSTDRCFLGVWGEFDEGNARAQKLRQFELHTNN